MELNQIIEKVKEAREASKQRNFTQTFDLVINLQNLDLKKPESKVDVGVTFPCKVRPKKYKILAIVDQAISGAENVFDKVLFSDDLIALKGNMAEIRKITHGYDKFCVQMNYMPQFAQILGRYLGPMGKMPSPKLGMVINPKTPIADLYEKLQKTVLIQTKKNLVLQASLGAESESDEVIAKNIQHVLDTTIHALPGHENNLKDANVKLTMGKLVRL